MVRRSRDRSGARHPVPREAVAATADRQLDFSADGLVRFPAYPRIASGTSVAGRHAVPCLACEF